jgi:hypothetical protein
VDTSPKVVDPMITIAQDFAFAHELSTRVWCNLPVVGYIAGYSDSISSKQGQMGYMNVKLDSQSHIYLQKKYYTINYGTGFVASENNIDTLTGSSKLFYSSQYFGSGFGSKSYKNLLTNLCLNKNKISGVVYTTASYSNGGDINNIYYSDTLKRASDDAVIIYNAHYIKNDDILYKDYNPADTIKSGITSTGVPFSGIVQETLVIHSGYPFITKGRVQIEANSKKFIVDFGSGALDDQATLIYEGKNTSFTLKRF